MSDFNNIDVVIDLVSRGKLLIFAEILHTSPIVLLADNAAETVSDDEPKMPANVEPITGPGPTDKNSDCSQKQKAKTISVKPRSENSQPEAPSMTSIDSDSGKKQKAKKSSVKLSSEKSQPEALASTSINSNSVKKQKTKKSSVKRSDKKSQPEVSSSTSINSDHCHKQKATKSSIKPSSEKSQPEASASTSVERKPNPKNSRLIIRNLSFKVSFFILQ